MDLRQLRYFVAVVATKNFTRAAEQMHIAQPPLSRQIQLLEDELGVQLLHRNSRPVRLTEAGRVFHEQALQVLHRVDQMKRGARQASLNQRQSISIAYVPSTLYGGLPMLVRKFRQRHPDTDIHLIDLSSEQQISELKAGRIDLGFGRIRSRDTTVARTVLREERLVLAVPPGTPLAASKERIGLEDIEQQRLIVFPKEPRPSFADHVLSLLHGRGIQLAEVHEVRELQAALGLVAAEMGVCIVPAAARLRSDLVYRLIDDEQATSPIILSHRLNDDSWYIPAIKELIAEMYAENPPWLDFGTNAFPGASSADAATAPASAERQVRTRSGPRSEPRSPRRPADPS
ncbi:LysR family transcriptional regulator [Variovorax sp. PvP013]|uniref:LysR family transcriptional regulator n=1 Tax=Variovorax sp. PvP013 TaxID=3156435 RepID=UPI003D1F5665